MNETGSQPHRNIQGSQQLVQHLKRDRHEMRKGDLVPARIDLGKYLSQKQDEEGNHHHFKDEPEINSKDNGLSALKSYLEKGVEQQDNCDINGIVGNQDGGQKFLGLIQKVDQDLFLLTSFL